MTMFYFEQRDHFARWWPCTAPVEPKERSAEGAARRIRAVQPVPKDLRHLNLTQMRAVLSPDGPLYATQFRSRRIAG